MNTVLCEKRIMYLVFCSYCFESVVNIIMTNRLVLVWSAYLPRGQEGDGAARTCPRPACGEGDGKGERKPITTERKILSIVCEWKDVEVNGKKWDENGGKKIVVR